MKISRRGWIRKHRLFHRVRIIMLAILLLLMSFVSTISPVNASGYNVETSQKYGKMIATGLNHSLALKLDGTVVAWGNNWYGQTDVPTGLKDVVAVAAGAYHSLALKKDGTVVAWGDNWYGQTYVPRGLNSVVAIVAGGYHSLALKSDGTIVAWGDNSYKQNSIPAGLNNVVAISAGVYHSLALKSDGTVVAWGNNSNGQVKVPAGLNNVVAISAGGYHSMALKLDGTVVAWGTNYDGQTNIPAGLKDVIAIDGGLYHSLALKSDGSVVAWGNNYQGQTRLPVGLKDVTAIVTGGYHSLALKSDGTVVAWGNNANGQINVPPGLSLLDTTPPTASIQYSSVNPTNQDVVATLVPNEPVTVINNEGSLKYTFSENGTFTFEFKDAAGNQGIVKATVTNIDKVAPTTTVNYSTTSPTNGNVIATIDPNEPITMTNNGGSLNYTFSENGSFTFKFIDAAGNPGTAEATIDNIDTNNPTATISYSTTDPTNGDVVATLHPSEAITVTNNSGNLDYTFAKNGSFTFEFKDSAGNKGSTTAEVMNIDKEVPTATVTYSKSDPTNGDVIATIVPNEHITVTNNGGSLNYTFNENGSFTFKFIDAAGNPGTVEANVTNIDKIAPTASISYSTTNPINGKVIAAINPSEAINVTNNEGSLNYTFDENGTYTFEFVDSAGNTGSAIATVTNIDKVNPTATVTYSSTDPTTQEVTVSINPSEQVTVLNNSGSTSYTFTKNGTFIFQFEDIAGNKGSVEATVSNIYINDNPIIQSITVPNSPVKINTNLNISAAFNDVQKDDTHTALIDWGDGQTSTGTVNEINGTGTVSKNHAYSEPGLYTIKVTVTDQNGGAAQSTSQYIVVYDPQGGYVTGNGSFYSPQGSYTADLNYNGNVTFTINSWYQNKNSTTPTGNTNFQFSIINKNFTSTSLDWMAISDNKAEYKGSGKWDNQSGYGFLVTAIDGGSTDKIRIKIWNKSSGAIIYDNLPGQPDTALDGTVTNVQGDIDVH
ncbi:hypothetical protein CN481_24445 [Bacillus sp. AFS006103]|nr:hypothetical protein CN481_24445 [Bacillus sp. AFS006103]